jgi:hypothetical protein
MIRWVLPGWYKPLHTDEGIELIRVAPADVCECDAKKLGGPEVAFYQDPPADVEVVDASEVLELIEYDDFLS